MRLLGLALTAGALLTSAQANAGGFPLNSGLNVAGGDIVEQVAVRVYVHEGNRYCFYFNGWHGPGWYRCGFAFRRGLGWGGVYGWNDWNYGPYERRYGRVHHGERFDCDRGSRRMGDSVDTRTRTRSTTGIETRSRSTTGSGLGGARVRGGATGNTPASEAPSGGGGKMQGGPSGEGSSTRGGGGLEGGAAGEGGPKRQ